MTGGREDATTEVIGGTTDVLRDVTTEMVDGMTDVLKDVTTEMVDGVTDVIRDVTTEMVDGTIDAPKGVMIMATGEMVIHPTGHLAKRLARHSLSLPKSPSADGNFLP